MKTNRFKLAFLIVVVAALSFGLGAVSNPIVNTLRQSAAHYQFYSQLALSVLDADDAMPYFTEEQRESIRAAYWFYAGVYAGQMSAADYVESVGQDPYTPPNPH